MITTFFFPQRLYLPFWPLLHFQLPSVKALSCVPNLLCFSIYQKLGSGSSSAGEITAWLSNIITLCWFLSVVPSSQPFSFPLRLIPKTVTEMWDVVKFTFRWEWEAHQLLEQTKVRSCLAGRYSIISSLLSESWLETLLRLGNLTVLCGFWGPELSMAL